MAQWHSSGKPKTDGELMTDLLEWAAACKTPEIQEAILRYFLLYWREHGEQPDRRLVKKHTKPKYFLQHLCAPEHAARLERAYQGILELRKKELENLALAQESSFPKCSSTALVTAPYP
jgi:hypothetical protein